jgi:ABC-2 type transport system permease protein
MSPYLSSLAHGMRRSWAAPGELAVRASFYVVILVVFASLWRVAVSASGGDVAGYGYRELMWYVAAAEAAIIASKPRMIEDIGTAIGSGAIAVEMLRPVSVVGFRVAAEFGEALVRLGCALGAGAVFLVVFVGGPPRLVSLCVFLPVVVIGLAVNLATQHAFAAAAFWLEDAKASWFLYQKLIFLLGGMLLPLEMLPGWLAGIARVLPFWVMAYVPARFASGHQDWASIPVQIAWLGAMLAAATGAFRLGERKLLVVGG